VKIVTDQAKLLGNDFEFGNEVCASSSLLQQLNFNSGQRSLH
jgi:hypothetical protein